MCTCVCLCVLVSVLIQNQALNNNLLSAVLGEQNQLWYVGYLVVEVIGDMVVVM